MKRITVTDEMHKFLMNVSKEMNEQCNRSTASPYFYQVQVQKRMPAFELSGTEAWCDNCGTLIDLEDERDILNIISEHRNISLSNAKKIGNEERDEILGEAGYVLVSYEWVSVYENFFLTEKACKEHIENQKHNYSKPLSYIQYASRNPEMEMMVKFFSELSLQKELK